MLGPNGAPVQGPRVPALPRVLAYHKVTRFELGGTWVSGPRFTRQIDALLADGFHFIDEDAFLAALDGEREPSALEVLLTFDDGYRGLLDHAIPILEERGIPALLFLVTDFVGRENTWELGLPGRRATHMGWDEAADLVRRGFSFGSHSRTHRDLTRLPAAEAANELAGSKAEIEARLRTPARSVSYPFGRLSAGIRAAAERAGYRAGFTLYPPRSTPERDRFALRREGVYVIDTIASIERKLGPGLPFFMEDLKGRLINGFAVITPILKGALAREYRPSRPRRPGR
jgi:peptidoglycan/xylan/chitin deacetylase (PgdA/CDA1 family)